MKILFVTLPLAVLTTATPSRAAVATYERATADPAPAIGAPEAECWLDRPSWALGSAIVFTEGEDERLIATYLDDVQLCMRSRGTVHFDEQGRIEAMGAGAQVILVSRGAGQTHTMEIEPAREGLAHAWFVNGSEGPLDDTAREWRDAMLGFLVTQGEITSLRGMEASMRGQIAALRGRESALRGQIASIRGSEASLRGEIAAARGAEAAERGAVASLRGRINALESAQSVSRDTLVQARLQAEVATLRREIAAGEARAAAASEPARIAAAERRLAAERAENERRIHEIEQQIGRLYTERETAAIEQQIAALDAGSRVRALEDRGEQAEERLRQVLRRLR